MTSTIDEITRQATEIISKPYTRRLEPDETGGYVATIHEFPGCIAEGNTAEEALRNLDHAALSWIEAALSTGFEIRDPVSFNACSGKIALRIPRGLHKQVAELAELEDISINQLLVTAISQYLGSKHTYKEMREAICAELRTGIPFSSTITIFKELSAGAMQTLPNSYHLIPPFSQTLKEANVAIAGSSFEQFISEPNRYGTC